MSDDNPRNEKRYSLYPMDTEEALRRAMNAGKPEDREKGEQKQEKPKGKGRKGQDDKAQ